MGMVAPGPLQGRRPRKGHEGEEDAVAPRCKASGRGSRVTHLLGYPTQNVSRSLRRKYAPPPCGGPEDVALAPCTAAAACEAGPSPVYVKVKSAEPADCAEGLAQCKNGLLVSSPRCEEPCAHTCAHPGLPPRLITNCPSATLRPTQDEASRRINAPLAAVWHWQRLWLVTPASGVGFPRVGAWMRALPSPDCPSLRTPEQMQAARETDAKTVAQMKTRESKGRSGEDSGLTAS
uniref:V-set and immunoglobulin domain containing 8 n=1 Tax=Saimiri boliviensis boliviensis TaxID=39432 RepID=A0A2K6TWR8_SAIBB